ncbi:NUDIX hydrolase [Novosphingobium sp. Rr 2-17]|uniref:NUDIX domain-containing protein n=1 Tax=Novosphingobium sp. Rr 2-17 TaxID=555793 RepID=UPI0002699F3E|nr:NUDIX domain-containing protein [Novosphingobium sp. Rr 2-17]EIZ77351.1 NUDIX hydrolase [Novosphingobium sp. Rr 2-17]
MDIPVPSDQPMPSDAPPVVPAATVVVFRRDPAGGPPQLLMLQRANEMRFAGGATVFPGGRVDPADRDLARRISPDEPEEIAASRIAAIRETLEEAGLLLATRAQVTVTDAARARAMLLGGATLGQVLDHFGWDLAPETLMLYAHWCPLWANAFDTRFFVHDLGTGAVDVTVDATENTRLFWASAAQALAMAERGDISVIFPTRRNLERLARFATFEDALADIAAHPVVRIHPCREMRNDGEWIVIPEGLGYPIVGEPRATARRG